MLKPRRAKIASAIVLALAAIIAIPVMAQSKAGGKFVCWKDKTGKVVGCGDSVPPEYRDSAGSQLDRGGMKRGAVESAEEAARRRAQEEATAKQKAEEKRRLAEQQRLDATLLNTYANEKEIDQRRERDLQQIELTITQLQAPLKNATDRYDDAKKRDAKEDMARAAAEKEKFEQEIAAKEKEKAGIAERYAAQRKRFTELTGGGQSAAAAPAAPASSPAAKPKK
jgi:hypothetical protein